MQNQGVEQHQPQQHAEQETAGQPLPRQNAILVFGSGGKEGRKIVAEVRDCCLLLVLAEQLIEFLSFLATCSF